MPGQQDAYTFSGSAGERVRIAADEVNNTSLSVFLTLFDASGTPVPGGQTSGDGSTGSVALPSTGTYTIIVSSNGATTYNVSLVFTTGRCGAATACGQTHTNKNIQRGQLDAYTFNANTGESVQISAVEVNNTSLSVFLTLYDPSGMPVPGGQTSGDGSTGSVALPSTGTYTIIVSSNGSTTYNLNLQFTTGCRILSVFGSVTNTNGIGLGDVRVTLSGTLTQITQTDASGNYLFTNLTPGGNYTVRPVSPLFVFNPERFDFLDLRGPRTANFVVAAQPVPSPTPFEDDFEALQRDPQKWNEGTLTQPPGAFDPQVSVVQQNGRLVITPRAGLTGMHYNGYVSVNSFDFANATANVEVEKAAANGAETIFGIGSDNNNYYRFVVGMSNSPSFAPFAQAALAQLGILEAVMPVLVFQVRINGVLTQLVIPYNPVLHRFWRFRHDGPMNAILFETSPDGITHPDPNLDTYTELHRVPLGKNIGALAVELSAGTATPVSGGGSAEFDDFSLTTSTAQFSVANFSVSEGTSCPPIPNVSRCATITVTRAGNVSSPGSITYATVDNPAAVPCDPMIRQPDGTPYPTGTAYARCDYATTIDTLTFAGGEISKPLTVPIIDDAHVEGNETLSLILLNSNSASVGVPGRMTLTITDNDTAGRPNPVIDNRDFFVRQQYLDFLSREPDQDGFDGWRGVLDGCADIFNPPQIPSQCDRIFVSGFGFFLSPEFRLKGFYVFTFYRVAFNRLAEYTEIVTDMRNVTGTTPTDTFARRAAFPVSFTGRREFRNLYDALNDQDFVDALMRRYNLQQITTPDPANPEGGVKVTLTRADLVSRLGATGTQALTRAQVLRAIVESDEVAAAEFTNTFVAVQYYGYLRRTPEPDGYQGWLNYLRDHPGDFRTMINGFLNSPEYRLRFGRP